MTSREINKLVELAQRLSLICGFCPSSRTFAIGLPFRPSGSAEADRPLLAETPLSSASIFGSIHYYEHLRVLVQGTFTP
jgi:hypothetical protein